MKKIKISELHEKSRIFGKIEKRGSYYDMSIDLMNNGFKTEALMLILATWNAALFRYHIKEFDVDGFKHVIGNECEPIFEKLKDQEFQQADFITIGKGIEKLYNILSAIKGIKYTGASKIMHMNIPKLFIMWDRYIQQEYGFDKPSGENYVEFLKKMQKLLKEINWEDSEKPLTKAIDEYNYVMYTIPKIEKEKLERRARSEKNKKEKIEFKLFKKMHAVTPTS